MELEHSFYSAHQGFMRGILVFNLYQMGSTGGLEAKNNQCRPTTTDLGKQNFFLNCVHIETSTDKLRNGIQDSWGVMSIIIFTLTEKWKHYNCFKPM
jgi:hypothetical protein